MTKEWLQQHKFYFVSVFALSILLFGVILIAQQSNENSITASVIGVKSNPLVPGVIGMSKGSSVELLSSTECEKPMNRAVYLDWEERGIGLEFPSQQSISTLILNITGKPIIGIDFDIYAKNNQGNWYSVTSDFDVLKASIPFDVRYTTCKGRTLSIGAVSQFKYGAINKFSALGIKIVTKHAVDGGVNTIPRLHEDMVVE